MRTCRPACIRASVPRRGLAGLLVAVLAVACATAVPGPPAAGTGTVWGYLKLVPREGVSPRPAGGAAYGDRRLRDVVLVDYSKPGFAVVHLGSGPSPAGSAELTIRSGSVRASLDPPYAALGAGGTLVVANATAAAHAVSAPSLGLIRRLEPGERFEIVLPLAGEHSLFLLDVPRSETVVFVSPGAFAVVADDGRFELAGLAPGDHELLAWHPRFPPARGGLHIEADAVVRLDLEMGVQQIGGMPGPAPANQP